MLMRSSKGGLTHTEIMNLTWRQFGTYLDAFLWLAREASKEGQTQNKVDDLEAMKKEPKVKAAKQAILDDTNKRMERHRNPKGKRKVVSKRTLV